MAVRHFSGFATSIASTVLVGAEAAVALTSGPGGPVPVVVYSALLLAALIAGPILIERTPWTAAAVFPVQVVLSVALLSQGSAACVLSPLAVVAEAIMYLRPRYAVAVIGAITASTIMIVATHAPAEAVGGALNYLTAVAFVVVFSHIAVRQHDARVRQAELAAELEELASARERNRIAREVHDGLGHALTVAHIQLEAARELIPRDPVRAEQIVARVQSVVQDGLRDVRRSVGILRDSARPQALRDALHDWAAELRGEGLAVELALPEAWAQTSPAAAHVLYRAAQEAVTNLRKHAAARSVAITVERRATALRMTIADDGKGSDGVPERGFGLVGLRERVAALGGTIDVATSPGRGFALTLELPA